MTDTLTIRAALAGQSIEHWREWLALDVETGWLTWRKPRGPAAIGYRAGSPDKDGYRYLAWEGRYYLEHRVIWALLHGRWPAEVDHVNMNRADNRPANLREASSAENKHNRAKQSNNTSGFKGVSFNKRSGKFCARLSVNKKCRSLGYFETAEQAHEAYQAAAKEMHGAFARF